MSRILSGIGLLALFGTITVQASMIACSDVSTLAQLISGSDPAMGCYNDDLIFKNFTYSGGGLITADRVNATAFFTAGASEDVQTWMFTPLTATGAASRWTTSFTLGYDVLVCQTKADGCLDPERFSRLRASADSMTAIAFGTPSTITDTETMGTLLVTGVSPGQLNYGEQTMIHTSSTATITFPILSYTQNFLESTPEPATYSMMVGGLLAALAFKKLKKA